jgi:hypothetical protein
MVTGVPDPFLTHGFTAGALPLCQPLGGFLALLVVRPLIRFSFHQKSPVSSRAKQEFYRNLRQMHFMKQRERQIK